MIDGSAVMRGTRLRVEWFGGKRGRPGTPLTAREIEILAAYARLSDQRCVAHEKRISVHTVKNLLESAYGRLDVTNVIEAYYVLGWLQVPAYQTPRSTAEEAER